MVFHFLHYIAYETDDTPNNIDGWMTYLKHQSLFDHLLALFSQVFERLTFTDILILNTRTNIHFFINQTYKITSLALRDEDGYEDQ